MHFPDVGGGRTDGGLFVKLKNGDKINGVFRGNPEIFNLHWVNKRPVDCDGPQCAHCKAGDKAKFRFRLNLITRVDGVYVARIFDGNYGTYLDLKDLHESGYNLEETALTIARSGEGTDTRYTVIPMPKNGGLTDKDFQAIAAIPLNTLRGEPEPAPKSAEAPSQQGDAWL